MMSQNPHAGSRIRPLIALRGFGALLRDPDDTSQVAVIRAALERRTGNPLLEQFLAFPGGETLLRRPTTLFDSLADRRSLARLPDYSLGRAYLAFMEREELSAEDIAALGDAPTSRPGSRHGLGPVLRARLLDMHDLLHVVTGNGRDLVGEASLAAFTYGQTGESATRFVVGLTYALTFLRVPGFLRPRALLHDAARAFESRATRLRLRRRMRESYCCGRDAGWIIGADWEALLSCPLNEVRRSYGIPNPVIYDEIRSSKAPIASTAGAPPPPRARATTGPRAG